MKFEHDFQQKIMVQTFDVPMHLSTAKDVLKWRSQWMQELKSWHSPYKAIVDCTNLSVTKSDEVINSLQIMVKFFEGLFLKSIVGFSSSKTQLEGILPFDLVSTFEEAQTKAGVRGMRSPSAPADFRSTIQFQNHFAQHVIELSFTDDVIIDSKERMTALKSKLTNNLMQWHSKWSLLVDCTHLSFDTLGQTEWPLFQKYFENFFMKACVGYSPKQNKDLYPFPVFRARHKAVAMLEAEGMFMGNDAHCRSAKTIK